MMISRVIKLANLSLGKLATPISVKYSLNSKPNPNGPVWTWNGWDPLEEVVVGVPHNAVVPSLDLEMEACTGPSRKDFFRKNGGKYWADVLPHGHWDKINEEIEGFAAFLKGEGFTVKRPEAIDFKKSVETPTFKSFCGIYSAMPRDLLLVIGDEIIEATLTWRCRYFEFHAFRSLILDYYKKGARWTACPKPRMREDFFNKDFNPNDPKTLIRVSTDEEPCFDAADFFRCGNDIFGQRSHVTNRAAIDWLRRHLAPQGIRVHEVNFTDPTSMHIDATLMPVRPGLAIQNSNYELKEKSLFEQGGWDIIKCPQPLVSSEKLYMTSSMIAINTFQLDERRVCVEKDEVGLQEMFRKIGMEPVPIALKHCFAIGGGFHCWTTDIRRKGKQQTYFNWSDEFLSKYEEKHSKPATS